jgi:thiol peroxidase
MAQKRTDLITFKSAPLTLVGKQVQPGDKAPDFVVRTGLTPDTEYTLASGAGKTRILNVVPSLDTGICDLQTRRFSQEAAALGDSAAIVTISLDLPPAQARWCGAAGVDNLTMTSDYYHRSFAEPYGLWIEELGLLARAVIIIDGDDIVRYVQLVPEVASEPNYEAVLVAAREVIGQ